MGGKTSSASKNKYNAKAYDQIPVRVPKGQRATIQAHADVRGESINSLIKRLILSDMGLQDWPQIDK